MTTLTNAVSGQSQNCFGNLEFSPGIGTRGILSGKHTIIPGHCRKKLGHRREVSQNSGGWSKFPGRFKLRPRGAQTAFVRVVTPRLHCFTFVSFSLYFMGLRSWHKISWPHLFEGWITPLFAIQWMSVDKANHAFCWIAIFFSVL